jgi:hypothetical protein
VSCNHTFVAMQDAAPPTGSRYPGDFIHAEAGSVDRRVWSETGCTCVLVTSMKDVLF